jgi:hypothetical protein
VGTTIFDQHTNSDSSSPVGTPGSLRPPDPDLATQSVTSGEACAAPSPGARRETLTHRLSRSGVALAFLGSWAWFGLHFACTAIYLLPISTLTARLSPITSKYMDPYFRQRWALFAPDPDGKTKHFQFRCRVENAAGVLTETPLFDLSDGYYASTWKTRLGPGHRVHRAYTSALVLLNMEDTKAMQAQLYLAQTNPEALTALNEQRDKIRSLRIEKSAELAGRLSAMACRRQFPTDRVVESSAAIDVVEPRPFAQRSDPRVSVSSLRIDFGWHAAGGVREML